MTFVQLQFFFLKVRSKKTKYIYGADVIVLEGIFGLYDERIRNLCDIKLFVETEDDIRLARRCIHKLFSPYCYLIYPFLVKRDIIDRGRSITGVLQQYERFVKTAYDDYIYPVYSFLMNLKRNN